MEVYPKTTASSSMLFDSDEFWVFELIRSDSLVVVCVVVGGANCGISWFFEGLGLAPNKVITLSNGINWFPFLIAPSSGSLNFPTVSWFSPILGLMPFLKWRRKQILDAMSAV